MTVVAPRTRIDLALPSDVAVADLLPMVLDLAREDAPDGGAAHGGWCLSRLGDAAIDPSRTLGSVGVVDGDLLQLRRRSENPPPPLFDDVADAIAASAPDSFRPWTEATARVLGQVAGGVALLTAAGAVLRAGPGLAAAVTAGVSAVVAVAVGAMITRMYRDVVTGVLVAASGLPLAFVGGLYAVPGAVGRPSLLLAAVLTLVFAVGSLVVIGHGITTFVAFATAAALGSGTFLVATLLFEHPAAGIAAGSATVAIGAISVLPRLTIQLAKLPIPPFPSNAEDLQKVDTELPDYAAIKQRTGVAHEYLTGMIIGCGAVASLGAVIAATGGTFGVIFAVVITAVLLLRARSYANGSQAIALLTAGMVTAVGLVLLLIVVASPLVLLLFVFEGLIGGAALALILGVVFPTRRFSPPLRRSVDIAEAILIASVLPLALAVMDLYQTFRQL
ncbi:MAG: type VII secretion integral membrane protein EccD [Actinomycetota bacterium]|nr:type VII secretion integral membrane protein EccD [Actinomycetota bacterium]